MQRLGWNPPAPESPNFTRFAPEGADLHELATTIAATLQQVYGVRGDETWVVSPPEFAQRQAGLEALDIVDPSEDDDQGETQTEQVLRTLREGSGIELAVAVSSSEVTFEDCLAAGLPRGERLAEMAMLYRHDCPLEFLRKSAFHREALGDPQLPLTTARKVLATRPTPSELSTLARRGDIAAEVLGRAALRGHRIARARGESGGAYLRLASVPPQQLTRIADQQDDETVGLLRNDGCPEDVVLRHVLARTARVRYAALAAVKRRTLAVDSALIRAARDLPMTERPNTTFPLTDRVRTLANRILADR